MWKFVRCTFCAAVLATLGAGSSVAQVPSTMPFQARLVDSGGEPIEPGTIVVFRIYSAATDGTLVWGPENHTVTPVNGVVSVQLGAGDTPVAITSSVFPGADRFLEVQVGGETLTPRFRIGSSAYSLRAGSVTPNSIGTAEVADNSLTAADLGTGSVGQDEIADGAVTATKIGVAAVGETKIAAGAVTNAKIEDGAVNAAKIATGAVSETKIAAGAVTNTKIGPDAVDGTKIADNAITLSHMADNSVDTNELASLAVTGAKIDNNTITAAKIIDEPGIASSATNVQNALAATAENLRTSQITVPGAGFVVAIAGASVDLNHVNGTGSVARFSVGVTTGTHNAANQRDLQVSAGAPTGVYSLSTSVEQVFPVTAGTTTVYFVANEPVGVVDANVIQSSLVLMYFPSSYGTVALADGTELESQTNDPAGTGFQE